MANGVRAFLISVLARQSLLLKGHFTNRYPVCWLVWEPGNWTPAGKNPQATMTQRPSSQGPRQPTEGDALCFELALAPGATELRMGRGPPNDIEVNDATISREHLRLSPLKDGGWEASALSDSTTVRNGSPLPAGQATVLGDGDQLALGGAHLTFHEPRGFAARLAEELKKTPRR